MTTIEAETINPATVITRDEAAPLTEPSNSSLCGVEKEQRSAVYYL